MRNVYIGLWNRLFMVKKMSGMFTISCKDIGGDDCGFSVTTHSVDEAKKAIFAHARYAHPAKLQDMSEEQKDGMLKMIDKKLLGKKK